MADENRFSGMADELDEANGEREESEEPKAPEVDEPAEPPEEPEEHDPMTDSAFEFEDSRQSAVYPREDVWDEFNDTLEWEVRRDLVEEGFENVTKRELHEAALRALNENPDQIVDQFEELRENA